jgi:hypothetical protein
MASHAFHPAPICLRDGPGGAVRSFSAVLLTDKTHIHLRSASVQTYTVFTTGIP